MFCGKCGSEVADTTLFCQSCGSKVGADGEAVQIGGQQNPMPPAQHQYQPVPVQSYPGYATLAADEKHCFSCGQAIKKAAEICPKCGVNQTKRGSITAIDVFCTDCGKTIKKAAEVCPFCGVRQGNEPAFQQQAPAGQTMAPPPPSISSDEKYCFSCGSGIKKAAAICPKCGVDQTRRSSINAVDLFCMACGKTVKKVAEICPFCGVRQEEAGPTDGYPPGYKPKSKTAAILFCIFLGSGGHRFYMGRAGSAIGMLALGIAYSLFYSLFLANPWDEEFLVLAIFTGIGLFVWWLVDLIRICTNKFTDARGYPLKKG